MATRFKILAYALGLLTAVESISVPARAAAAEGTSTAPKNQDSWISPAALAASPDGKTLYIAGATAGSVAVFDITTRRITSSIPVPASPGGLALSADGRELYVTCEGPVSQVAVIDCATGKVLHTLATGHTAMSPVPTPDGKSLYVCNRFNNAVAVIDLGAQKESARIPVPREPVAAALTPDAKYLLVANHLHASRADADSVSASVSVIEVATGRVIKELALPNGSGLLRDIRISPDGRFACVTHLLSRFHLPTTQLERGWMNTNALTLIDLAELKVINTVLLDNVDSGAANPWAAAWTADGKLLVVTHAGTHEVSVIDAPALLAKLAKIPETAPATPPATTDYSSSVRSVADVPNDLAFLVDLRRRVKLTGRGPRALAVVGHTAYVGDYFTDTLEILDLDRQPLEPVVVELHPDQKMTVLRRGEMLFNDASICFQGWQSCGSCHSSDARVDGLNWDLLNDGIGNPKNTKSLLLAHSTPPAMSMGVRDTAETAVRSGIQKILFTVQPEEVAVAIDEWLKSLKPIPSPKLVKGKMSASAQRGEKLFNDAETGCAVCHEPGLFTDLKSHDVGTRGQYDKPEDIFDTPTLIEIWRTAPFLHDGSAVTVRDVLTTHNTQDRHGKTSHLTKAQLDDLVEYLLSL